jgi:hypothetical protein
MDHSNEHSRSYALPCFNFRWNSIKRSLCISVYAKLCQNCTMEINVHVNILCHLSVFTKSINSLSGYSVATE